MIEPHIPLSISDASQTGEARRIACLLAGELGFDSADTGRVGVVVTEAATNIVKHAGQGTLLLRPLRESAARPGIEVLALDQGPGMADVEICQRDGYSTAGSPGTGLGAIARLSSAFELYSGAGLGTGLLIRLLPRGAQLLPDGAPMEVGAVRTAAPGETVCGDDWALATAGGRVLLLVADGLGHGEAAAAASSEAVRSFRSNLALPADRIVDALHGALLATRGAAVSVADLDLQGGRLLYAGIGNVSGLIAWPGGSRSLVGQNGTVGGAFRSARAFSYPWVEGAVLILFSDGLTSHVGLQRYPGLVARHPSLIAGVLYRDFARGRDDATIVVARRTGAAA